MLNLKRGASWLVGPNASRQHLEAWIARCVKELPAGFTVLDAGAGESPYRHLFSDGKYESADFEMVDKAYRPPTYSCDLTDLPVADGTYDLVLLTQVLEHLPKPTEVLRELHRTLKPGGLLLASAPLFYEEHEAPYDYFRYTKYAWKVLADDSGLEIVELERLEGYYATLAYQLLMAAKSLPMVLLPLRIAFLLLAAMFNRSDAKNPRYGIGMPKNYRVVMRRPVDAIGGP